MVKIYKIAISYVSAFWIVYDFKWLPCTLFSFQPSWIYAWVWNYHKNEKTMLRGARFRTLVHSFHFTNL
jgi:hypothetical protein